MSLKELFSWFSVATGDRRIATNTQAWIQIDRAEHWVSTDHRIRSRPRYPIGYQLLTDREGNGADMQAEKFVSRGIPINHDERFGFDNKLQGALT